MFLPVVKDIYQWAWSVLAKHVESVCNLRVMVHDILDALVQGVIEGGGSNGYLGKMLQLQY